MRKIHSYILCACMHTDILQYVSHLGYCCKDLTFFIKCRRLHIHYFYGMDKNEYRQKILQKTESYIRAEFDEEGSGHDWWHIYRVKNMALHIASKEGGDLFIIEMAALLHDLDDWKLSGIADNRTLKWLKKLNIDSHLAGKIIRITEQISFKGAGVKNVATSPEAQIVQDADRLDAIGAVGIARTFAYGGNKGRLIYHPDVKPKFHADFNMYKKGAGPTINHFYEKLLLLKDRLNTKTAREIAEERHRFMEEFLERFYLEWEAKI